LAGNLFFIVDSFICFSNHFRILFDILVNSE